MLIREAAQDKLKFARTGISGLGLIGRFLLRSENTVRIVVQGSGAGNLLSFRGSIADETPILLDTLAGDGNIVLDTSSVDYLYVDVIAYGGNPFALYLSGFFFVLPTSIDPLAINKRRRAWYWQDFPAGSGPFLTLTSNANGIGGAPWDSSKIINNSAVLTTVTNKKAFTGLTQLFSNVVEVATQTGAAVTLTGVPNLTWGNLRVYYLYEEFLSNLPDKLQYAPDIVTKARLELWDSMFLDAELNLADLTDKVAARYNLGLAYYRTFSLLDWFSADAGDTYKININHLLGTIYPVVSIYDSDDLQVMLHKIEVQDLNNVNIYVSQRGKDGRFAGRILIGCLN